METKCLERRLEQQQQSLDDTIPATPTVLEYCASVDTPETVTLVQQQEKEQVKFERNTF